MRMLNRRNFVRGVAQTAAGFTAGSIAPKLTGSSNGLEMNESGITAVLPMPIQIVVDDVGWWSGHDGSKQQEPYRTGIPRNHVPEDYEAIAQLGRALNIRPQAAMILCEWDKENILRKLPTSTWMGPAWDNKKWVGPWLEKAADIIRNNAKHFELTLHGVGHEFWSEGRFTRAEWADSNGVMRPVDQVEAHLDAYESLLNQHQLGPLPSSFVPTAFLHGFGPTDGHNKSIAEILKRRGIVYINTPFDSMQNRKAVRYDVFGFDAGVITIDRGQDLLDWNNLGMTPTGELRGPTCGMHWPNLLHLDPKRNSEIVEGWIRFLQPYQYKLGTLLATDSESFRTQLVHRNCTQLTLTRQEIQLDFTGIDALFNPSKKKELILKIRSPHRVHLEADSIRIASQALSSQEGDCLYTLSLERIPGRKLARLKMKILST